MSLSRQRTRKAKPRVTRYLEEELWNEIKPTIDSMPRDTDRDRTHYVRIRRLFSLLYLCGLRISEVANNTMGGFSCRRGKDGESQWWLEILGKGNKTRLVRATKKLMIELAYYRKEKDLSPLPTPAEATPLLLPIGRQHRTLTPGMLHVIVKHIFEYTATRLRASGIEFESIAIRVEAASAHWMDIPLVHIWQIIKSIFAISGTTLDTHPLARQTLISIPQMTPDIKETERFHKLDL